MGKEPERKVGLGGEFGHPGWTKTLEKPDGVGMSTRVWSEEDPRSALPSAWRPVH